MNHHQSAHLLTNHSALTLTITFTHDNNPNAPRCRGAAAGVHGHRIHALLVPRLRRTGGLSRVLLARPRRCRATPSRVPPLCAGPRSRGPAVRAEVRGSMAAARGGGGGWRRRGGGDVGAPARRAACLALPLLPPQSGTFGSRSWTKARNVLTIHNTSSLRALEVADEQS